MGSRRIVIPALAFCLSMIFSDLPSPAEAGFAKGKTAYHFSGSCLEFRMSFLRIYLRVLGLLRSDAKLAITLALANIALAGAQFVEPVLLGRIVDALSGALPAGLGPAAQVLAPLIGAWVGFGLFIIGASTLVAWFADRLAPRRRNMVLADYFEHV